MQRPAFDPVDHFLLCREWRVVRMRVLERDGAKCACCGKTAAHGVVINVDHIKPRSRYSELALTETNLQVLCDGCNQGKGNTYETDWRRSQNAPRSTRRAPSISRELLCCLLLHPNLPETPAIAAMVPSPENDTLVAVANYLIGASHQFKTVASICSHFQGSVHLELIAEAIVTIDEGHLPDQSEVAAAIAHAVRWKKLPRLCPDCEGVLTPNDGYCACGWVAQ